MGDSLWQRREPERAYLFLDSKARNVGDLLTLIVSQSTDVDSRDKREMNKKTDIRERFSLVGSSNGGLNVQAGSASLDAQNASARDFKGDAQFRSERVFTDHVTVTVVDVLANGNMVISGKRRVWIAGDETVLVVTGVVRNVDIGPDNTILSRYVSELTMSYESRGPEKKFTRQGWLGRGMNHVWPF